MRVPRSPSVSFPPLRREFSGYGLKPFSNDLLAAFAVALMTIPQSIAYSLLAGLPPTAGLYSAIFGTIFTAALGSSRHLISGPSTGVAILIQTSIADILYNYFDTIEGAARDDLVLHILGQIVLLSGLIQIGAAFFNVSKLLQFVSRPVILGYFMGIMMAIYINQFYYFFGIPSQGPDVSQVFKAWKFLAHLQLTDWKTLLIGLGTLGLLLLIRKRKSWKILPDALFVLVIASLIVYALSHWLVNAPLTPTLETFGLTDHPLPKLTLPLVDFWLINKIFAAAVAIAFLATLEVFSISRHFSARSGQQIQVNQDVLGLGAGNFVLSFLIGSMPASGSATRTSVNFNAKAKTRLAAIFSGFFTAAIVFFGWPLVQHIPLASLAALLIASAPVLVDFKEVKLSMRTTTEDRWVFLLTFVSCLIFSLDIAFFIGIVISIGTYLRRSAIPHLVEYAFNAKGRLMTIGPKEEVHRKVRIIGIAGDLYFGSADVFQSALQSVASDPNVQAIVLRLNNVYHMDASMCLAIQQLHETLALTKRHLVISGLTEEVWHVFHRAGLVKQIGLENLYFTDESNPQFSTWKACLHAQEQIHRDIG